MPRTSQAAALVLANIVISALYVGYQFLDEDTRIVLGLLCLNVLLIAAICWLVIAAFDSKGD